MLNRVYPFLTLLLILINILSQTPIVEWLIDDSLMIDFDIDSEDNIIVLNKDNMITSLRHHILSVWCNQIGCMMRNGDNTIELKRNLCPNFHSIDAGYCDCSGYIKVIAICPNGEGRSRRNI